MSVPGPVRSLVLLKWSLLAGGFRLGLQEKVQLVLAVVFSLGAGVVAVAGFTAVGRGSSSADDVVVVVLPTLSLVVALLATSAATGTTIDVRNLAAEPLRPRELGNGMLAAAVVGPATLAGALSGVGLALGWFPAGPVPAVLVEWVLVGLVVLAWWATLLLVARTCANALGVLVNGRLRSAAQVLAAVSGLGLFLLAQLLVDRLVRWTGEDWDRAARWAALTPPGQLGRALAAADGRPVAAVGHLLLGAVWLVPLWFAHAWATGRLAVAPIRDVPRRSRRARRADRSVEPASRPPRGWSVPGRAVARRTLVTKRRNPREAVNTSVAMALGVSSVVIGAVLADTVDGRLVLGAGLLHFAVVFEANNAYGYDGRALGLEVQSGVTGRALVTGKVRASVSVLLPAALAAVAAVAWIVDGWSWVLPGMLLAGGSVLLAAGVSAVGAVTAPFALPDSPNPLAAGDPGQGCLAGAVLIVEMVVLTVVSVPFALAVWWASTVSVAATVGVAALVLVVEGALLAGGIALAVTIVGGREHALVDKVTPAR